MESHARYEQLIDELILLGHTESPRKWKALRAHLATCPRCQDRYNRAALAERMLDGGAGAIGTPSTSSFDRIAAVVLSETATPPHPLRRALSWLAPPQRWGLGVATAAVLAVLIPFFVARPRDGEFQSRGGTGERTAGVRAFCLDSGGVTPRCSAASQLRLTISNAGKFRYVFLVGLDDSYGLKWYAPRPPALESVAAPTGIDVPLGDAVRLGVNHDPGSIRVYALFSDAPLTTAEIEAAVARMRTARLAPKDAETLPLERTDVAQHSVTFDVAR